MNTAVSASASENLDRTGRRRCQKQKVNDVFQNPHSCSLPIATFKRYQCAQPAPHLFFKLGGHQPLQPFLWRFPPFLPPHVHPRGRGGSRFQIQRPRGPTSIGPSIPLPIPIPIPLSLPLAYGWWRPPVLPLDHERAAESRGVVREGVVDPRPAPSDD